MKISFILSTGTAYNGLSATPHLRSSFFCSFSSERTGILSWRQSSVCDRLLSSNPRLVVLAFDCPLKQELVALRNISVRARSGTRTGAASRFQVEPLSLQPFDFSTNFPSKYGPIGKSHLWRTETCSEDFCYIPQRRNFRLHINSGFATFRCRQDSHANVRCLQSLRSPTTGPVPTTELQHFRNISRHCQARSRFRIVERSGAICSSKYHGRRSLFHDSQRNHRSSLIP